MWIACLADDSYEMPNLVFSEIECKEWIAICYSFAYSLWVSKNASVYIR